MIAVYVAHPYTADNLLRKKLNIESARYHGVLVTEAGGFPLMPTVNTALFDSYTDEGDWGYYIEGTNDQLLRCDAALFCAGWHNSKGCVLEMKTCKESGIPYFFDIQKLEQYINDIKSGEIL